MDTCVLLWGASTVQYQYFRVLDAPEDQSECCICVSTHLQLLLRVSTCNGNGFDSVDEHTIPIWIVWTLAFSSGGASTVQYQYFSSVLGPRCSRGPELVLC